MNFSLEFTLKEKVYKALGWALEYHFNLLQSSLISNAISRKQE